MPFFSFRLLLLIYKPEHMHIEPKKCSVERAGYLYTCPCISVLCRSPLHMCAYRGSVETLDYLIASGADFNIADK
jgi:ankyrin repeat protein